jgi:5-formyltetrahydrofolate cyclo-ligase
MIPEEKQMLRSRMRELLRAMSGSGRAASSTAIAGHLANVSGVVFGFAPMKLEPDWTAGIRATWQVALPRIEGDRLEFHRVGKVAVGSGVPFLPSEGRAGSLLSDDFSHLQRGLFGVREPAKRDEIPLCHADVILVPGLAFDRKGARLGRGGGFYDRLLADPTLSARKVAVCFLCQLVERVPVELHDAKVDAIVTEDGWIEVRSSGCGRG